MIAAAAKRAYGPPGQHPKMPKSMRSHEELATPDPIAPTDPIPDFLESGGSAKEAPENHPWRQIFGRPSALTRRIELRDDARASTVAAQFDASAVRSRSQCPA